MRTQQLIQASRILFYPNKIKFSDGKPLAQSARGCCRKNSKLVRSSKENLRVNKHSFSNAHTSRSYQLDVVFSLNNAVVKMIQQKACNAQRTFANMDVVVLRGEEKTRNKCAVSRKLEVRTHSPGSCAHTHSLIEQLEFVSLYQRRCENDPTDNTQRAAHLARHGRCGAACGEHRIHDEYESAHEIERRSHNGHLRSEEDTNSESDHELSEKSDQANQSSWLH